jgi:hypothetical protein
MVQSQAQLSLSNFSACSLESWIQLAPARPNMPTKGRCSQSQNHHRSASQERAGIERARRHDRVFVRGLHRRHRAPRSAPRVEGRRARKPDGGWLDGRRLVPLRRNPMARRHPSRKARAVPKTVLRLPDLDQATSAVPNCLGSHDAQRGYRHAIDEFIEWYCSEPRLSLSKAVVLRYRMNLESRKLAPGTVNCDFTHILAGIGSINWPRRSRILSVFRWLTRQFQKRFEA